MMKRVTRALRCDAARRHEETLMRHRASRALFIRRASGIRDDARFATGFEPDAAII